ncbi:DUF6473 family protein [Pseudorhodobacter aquimaris]|uniref:DUF6473 family protein n=1 Tax=Pseudorhodobacter aquimaris TaxID=687412 RepID=UPI00067B2DAD|nr:DUF6473 family protein [Pseudorhodobacter aquimaris]
MAYVYPSDVPLDYQTCRYGTSKLSFRGPKHNLVRPYFVTIGGTETYGKFVKDPFPDLVAAQTGMPVVNLGCMNAGPDVFLKDPEALDIASGADLTIVQVVGAANLTNPFYAVHPRRNDRFLRANPSLQNMYRDVDFTEFHFTRHMLQTLFQVSPHRFVAVAAQLQAVWVERMSLLLQSIKGKTLLLWMADHAPSTARADANPYSDPVLVHTGMIDQLRQHASAYMEVVTSEAANHEGIDDMVFSPLERHAAEGVPGPLAHREVADALNAGINQLLAA